jgi:hypothetical protein
VTSPEVNTNTGQGRDDRKVHGRSRNGWDIVRYDRAGKWYLEREGEKRQSVKLEDAARLAAWAHFYPGKPGGQAFDTRVRKIRAAS